jgi:aminomethyltransferase
VIGEVTSGTQSPSLSKGIGMGYVSTAHTDSEIYISIRDKAVKAAIVKMPFL